MIVKWPDGTTTKQVDVAANQRLSISYNEAAGKSQKQVIAQSQNSRLFQTIEDETLFKHEENPFNDFESEVLLPHKNSTLGPALAVGDLNGDGRDDYIVGSAIGQVSSVYLQTEKGKFEALSVPALFNDKYYEDLGIVIFDADQDGDQDFYIASGGNEFKPNSDGYEDRFYENLGNNQFRRNKEAIPSLKGSNLNVSTCDFDQDGDLDLFVGGRLVPKQYPYPADSHLLENVSTPEGVKFIDATQKSLPDLKELGLVSASTWLDFNQDGWQDLVVVGEWMPIKFFQNNTDGTFADVSEKFLEEDYRGWWFDIQKGDFDNDGDEDLVVGNLGQNYKYQASPAAPFKVYLNDFDANRSADIVLSYEKDEIEFPVRGRQCSSQQMPAIKAKFKDYNSFASANLKQIYTTKLLEEALSYEITSFASIYLENQGGSFKARALPQQAQISSINKFVVADFDSDGIQDLVLAGNLYNAEVETPRNDASFGLFLKGDGLGGFEAQSMMESGLKIVGDVRGMALLKQKGERHLLVAKNNDRLQMIRCPERLQSVSSLSLD